MRAITGAPKSWSVPRDGPCYDHGKPRVDEAVLQDRRLVNDAMDLGDRYLGLAHLGHVEASCRSNLTHGWHKR